MLVITLATMSRTHVTVDGVTPLAPAPTQPTIPVMRSLAECIAEVHRFIGDSEQCNPLEMLTEREQTFAMAGINTAVRNLNRFGDGCSESDYLRIVVRNVAQELQSRPPAT